MIKLYLSLFIATFLGSSVYSQIKTPTMAEMYDFAPGDTFEYEDIGTGIGLDLGVSYSMITYVNREDYGHDSIVYTYKRTKFLFLNNDWYHPFSISRDSVTWTSVNLDSAYYAFPNAINNFDSTGISIGTDTIYKTWEHDSAHCRLGEDEYYTLYLFSAEYILGLGESFREIYFPFCGYRDTYKLIYYHKADGRIFGTPYNFAVGINDMVGNEAVYLFPNPSSGDFQLQLTEKPIKKTYLQIFDGLGRLVKEEEINSTLTNIERRGLSNGMYYWQVMSGDKIIARNKLVLN